MPYNLWSLASPLTKSLPSYLLGINIRQKSKELVELIQDDERLREERRKARKNKDKYIGLAGAFCTEIGALLGIVKQGRMNGGLCYTLLGRRIDFIIVILD